MTTMPASTGATEETPHTSTTTTTPAADPPSTNNNAVQQISPPPPTKKKALLERLKQQVGDIDTKLEAINTQQGSSSSSLTHTPLSANASLQYPSSQQTSTNINVATSTPSSKASSSNGKRFVNTTSGAALPSTPEPNTPTRSKRTRRPNKFNQLINGEELPTLPEHIQRKLAKLIVMVRRVKWAWPFNQPVDPVQLNIPDYFNIIKNPMDLGTVERKVLNNEYMDVYQFLDDVRLIWSNCYTYNPLDSDVCRMAKDVEKFFNEKYEKLIGQVGVDTPLEIPTQSIGLEETTPSSTVKKGRGRKKKSLTTTSATATTSTPSAVPSSTAATTTMTTTSEQVSTATTRETTPSKSKTSSKSSSKSKTKSSSKPKSKSKKSSEPEMTYEEKKELSANIGKLDGEKLAEVVRIIQRMAPTASSKANETEIEIDLNKLDNATLVELNNFVKQHLPKKESQKKKATSTKKKRKTSPVKEKKPKKTKKEESDSESTATDNSASESSATETESSESDSSDSDSDMEDVKTVPPSANNLGDQAKHPKTTTNEGK